MGDWYMENGERSPHMDGMAYDYDNSAWCEMGSTAGSTPVWWRTRSDLGGGQYGVEDKAAPKSVESASAAPSDGKAADGAATVGEKRELPASVRLILWTAAMFMPAHFLCYLVAMPFGLAAGLTFEAVAPLVVVCDIVVAYLFARRIVG